MFHGKHCIFYQVRFTKATHLQIHNNIYNKDNDNNNDFDSNTYNTCLQHHDDDGFGLEVFKWITYVIPR